MTAETDDRKRQEAEFHDRRERDRKELSEDAFEAAYSNSRFYAIARKGRLALEQRIAEWAPGAVALDYCCGRGGTSLNLAKAGAFVHGIDISAESVEAARQRLADAGLADRASFQVMDAEKMTFPSATFDLIICSGVLHHLDVHVAYAELARVLKPNGRIIALEALGYNPAFQLYRKLTPRLRTAWEAEHILTLREVAAARKYFKTVDTHFFYLTSLLAVPFRNSPAFDSILSVLERADDALLRIPGVRAMAWQMMFILSDPRR